MIEHEVFKRALANTIFRIGFEKIIRSSILKAQKKIGFDMLLADLIYNEIISNIDELNEQSYNN